MPRPTRARVASAVMSMRSASSLAAVSASTSAASRAVSAWFTRPRACPTSLPNSAFFSGATFRSCAFNVARGEPSAECAERAAFSSAVPDAEAIASSAAATADSTDSGVISGLSDTRDESTERHW